MLAGTAVPRAMGIDFGTTNSVVALADGKAAADLVSFARSSSQEAARGKKLKRGLMFYFTACSGR